MKKILISFLSIMLVFGCTKDFKELNTNPTTTSEVPTSNLLTAAIQGLASINSSLGYNKNCMFYVQQWSQREETGDSRYGEIQNGWSSFYLRGMPELYNIIELNQGENKANYTPYGSNNNQIAVAKILRAWAFHNMTDAWGNIPYSEVGNTEIDFPKYDSQESIYKNLISELKDANNLISTEETGVVGDQMFNGDMAKWKAFANSLRARVALRMSNVDPALAEAELSSAISDGVMMSNDDNAIVNFQEEEDYSNPLFIEFKVQQWTYVSDVLVNQMKQDASNVDPRLEIYADPAKNIGEVVGFPYGLDDDASTEILQDDGSHPGELVRSATFGSIFMSHAEMMFIKAEAAQRGWISGDAETFYQDAIRSSMSFWGVDETATDTYLSASHVVYDAANWKKSIGMQKWVAFYTQGAQSWAEYRRIGFPVLTIPPIKVFNDATSVPRRFFYPLEEQNTNSKNLEAAISSMGGDGFNTRVWWDKN